MARVPLSHFLANRRPRRALVIVHLSSLDSLAWSQGDVAAEALAARLASAVRRHPGPVVVLDQGWAQPSPARRLVAAALDARADVTRLRFDEDTAPWGPFLTRLARSLRRLGVGSVRLGGLWWDEASARSGDAVTGCATTVYRALREGGFRVTADRTLLAIPDEAAPG